ncbi:MAG: hypothetical protein QOG99_2924 [Frankiales bacterium]|jgi:dihydrofolate reductase|nr:hypothetical protein [Frankiales bacterium]
MRKLVVTEFVSLDGVMEAPGGEPGYAHTGWVERYFDEALGACRLEEQLAADILLLGRVTYESFYGAWPTREGEMADKINTMTKYVVSSTLDASDWHDTHVIGFDRVNELEGNVLVVGSRTLVHGLLDAGLVDELSVQVFPVVLGSGARLYPESPDRLDLSLVGSQTTAAGVLLNRYVVG